MRRDRLRLSSPLKHEKLRENRHRFQKDRERPENLYKIELVVEEQGEDQARADEVLDAEGIDGRVMCRSV